MYIQREEGENSTGYPGDSCLSLSLPFPNAPADNEEVTRHRAMKKSSSSSVRFSQAVRTRTSCERTTARTRTQRKSSSYQDNRPPCSIDSVITSSSIIACSHMWWTSWIWHTGLLLSSTSFLVLHLFIHRFCSIILLLAVHNDARPRSRKMCTHYTQRNGEKKQ